MTSMGSDPAFAARLMSGWFGKYCFSLNVA